MINLKLEDVVKLADLAKIEVTESEANEYQKDINNILGHLAMVNEASTDDSKQNIKIYNQLREDSLDPRDFSRDIIFADIPSKSTDNYVRVSKVIKK